MGEEDGPMDKFSAILVFVIATSFLLFFLGDLGITGQATSGTTISNVSCCLPSKRIAKTAYQIVITLVNRLLIVHSSHKNPIRILCDQMIAPVFNI